MPVALEEKDKEKEQVILQQFLKIVSPTPVNFAGLNPHRIVTSDP